MQIKIISTSLRDDSQCILCVDKEGEVTLTFNGGLDDNNIKEKMETLEKTGGEIITDNLKIMKVEKKVE